jgi:hypothetical protein
MVAQAHPQPRNALQPISGDGLTTNKLVMLFQQNAKTQFSRSESGLPCFLFPSFAKNA